MRASLAWQRLGQEALGVLLASGLVAGASCLLQGVPSLAPEATGCSAPEGEGIVTPWVDVSAAANLLVDGAAFCDARSEEAYESGHVAGALSVPMDLGALDEGVIPLLAAAPVVVTYCDTSDACSASIQLARLLATAGLRDVRVLEGGFPAWLESGNPAEAGPCHACP